MEKEQKCCFCSTENAKYTCPRCSATYCSKSCYQCPEHMNCSEQFYQECVEEELKLENIDESEKKKMLDILQRFHANSLDEDILNDRDSDDEDSVPDLSERLQNIDLDDADRVWECLTEQEKQEFQAILKNDEITQLVPDYEPWWSKRYDKKIEELDSFLNKETAKKYKEICPSIAEIVPFSTISKVHPAPCILWNITNILASYTFTVRRYIGDHHHNIETVNTIFSICMNLSSNANFESKETAIESVVYHANSNTNVTCSPEEAALIFEDVNKLLAGPENSAVEFYILAALSDLQALFFAAKNTKREIKSVKGEFSKKYPVPLVPIDKTKLHRSIQKLTFYLSWTNEFYSQNATIQ